MINIKFHDISIKSASNKSGVMTGHNFAPNWSTFTKSNTNNSGSHTNFTDSINIILDNDGYDFTTSDTNGAEQIVISKFANNEKNQSKKDSEGKDKSTSKKMKKNTKKKNK